MSLNHFIKIFTLSQNDHGPEFSESTYNVTVREDAPAGTVIAILGATDKDFGATDKDFGEFGKVRIFLNLTFSMAVKMLNHIGIQKSQ